MNKKQLQNYILNLGSGNNEIIKKISLIPNYIKNPSSKVEKNGIFLDSSKKIKNKSCIKNEKENFLFSLENCVKLNEIFLLKKSTSKKIKTSQIQYIKFRKKRKSLYNFDHRM